MYVITLYFYATTDDEFVRLLQYRFERHVMPGMISDIYDGSEYLRHSEFFKEKFNISFSLNFDGAPQIQILLHANLANSVIYQ